MLKENVRKPARVIAICMILVLILGLVIPTVHATDGSGADSANASGSWIVILGLVLVCFVAIGIALYLQHKNVGLKRENIVLSERIKKYNVKTHNLHSATADEVKVAYARLDELEAWKKAACMVNPNLETDIRKMQAKLEAEEFKREYADILERESTHANYGIFCKAISCYYALSEMAKGYTKFDISSLIQKRTEAVADFVANAKEHLEEINRGCTNAAEFLAVLNEAEEYYECLPQPVKNEIPINLMGEIRLKKAMANYNTEDACEDADVSKENTSFCEMFVEMMKKVGRWIKKICGNLYRKIKERVFPLDDDDEEDEED